MINKWKRLKVTFKSKSNSPLVINGRNKKECYNCGQIKPEKIKVNHATRNTKFCRVCGEPMYTEEEIKKHNIKQWNYSNIKRQG